MRMIATRLFPLIFISLLLMINSTQAQECNNCNLTPSIALFDFDIQIQKPADPLPQTTWVLLHGLSWHANNHIIKNNGNCVYFIEPFSKKTGGVETIQMSETFSNLPGPGNVAGEYFITGTVTEGLLDYVLDIRLHASCSKKVIETSQVQFAKGSDQLAMINAAKLAAGKFLNLEKLIRQSELSERSENAGADISANNSKPIAVKIAKTTLKAGEKTDVILELKDCDGKPIAGREVFFNATTFEGMKIPGTIGGTMTPAQVTTDENGIAKTTFTLNTGSAKAMIAAHSPGKDVKGCGSILFGDAAINIRYTHSGYVTYTFEGRSGLTSDTSDKTMAHFYTGREITSISYRASFYGEGDAGGVYLSSSDDDVGTAIPNILEFGTYNYLKTDYWKNTVICNCAMKGDVTEQDIKSTGSGEIKNSSIQFDYNEGAGRLSLSLNFNSTNTYSFEASNVPSQNSSSQDELNWPVNFDTMLDKKDFTIKKEKVGNKIRYTAEGMQSIKVNLLSQLAKVKMVMWEE